MDCLDEVTKSALAAIIIPVIMNPSDIIISYSLALYSNWYYHKPTRCLFDAGEGVATSMGKKIFAIRDVFLTHGHEDHIAGISNLVNIRNLASGERDKPLTIYYPKHDPWINALFEYIEKKQSGMLRYPLYAQPLEPGEVVDIKGARRPTKVVAFEMKHAKGQLCLGYEIDQERKEVDAITGQIMYKNHSIFFYTGDGYEPCHSPYGRADIALFEATFLARDAGEAATNVDHRHATVRGAIDWAASADVKALILCHISDRYTIEEVIEEAAAMRSKYGFRGDLYIAYREKIVTVYRCVPEGKR